MTLECYSCGSQRHSFYAEENGYSLVKCNACGLLFVENPPSNNEISEAHRLGQHRGTETFDVTGFPDRSKVRKYVQVLGDLFEEGLGAGRTLLDIGCGYGEFLEAVRKHSGGSVAATGVEPNARKREFARKHGLDVQDFDVSSHRDRYDYVSMLNVFSHLPNPPTFIGALRSVLGRGGELILETGNTADMPSADHHRPFSLPNHLSFASEAIVVRVLERLGFDVIGVRKYPLMRFTPNRMLRECVKTILPRHRSRLRYFFRRNPYSEADMFVRARLTNW